MLSYLRPATLFVLSLCVVQAASRQSDIPASAAFADLVRSAGHLRIVEGRLTGGFSHGHWSLSAERTRPGRDVTIAASRVLERQPADSHHGAVARLFLDEPDVLRRAAARALEGRRPTAAFASDLAAIQLSASRDARGEGALDAARALHHAQQALSLEPDLPEALFNRAIALERLAFHEAAARAWEEYLVVDGDGAWAREARDRLQTLRQPATTRLTQTVRDRLASAIDAGEWPEVDALVNRIPQAAREHLDDVLLPAWAEAVHRHDDDRAARSLEQIRQVARLLMARHGEQAWHRLAKAMARHAAHPREALASALIALKDVRGLVDRNRIEEASTRLEKVAASVSDVAPLRASIQFWRLYIDWYRGRRDMVATETARLAQACERDRFIYLQARALNMQASTLNSLARYADAQIASRKAAEIFTLSGEREYAASAQASLGTHLAFQGDLRTAWTEQRKALASIREIDSLRRRFVVLGSAVILATRFGLPDAALALQAVLVDEARRWGDAGALVRLLLERARLHFDLGNRRAGRDDVAAAERIVEQMADPSYRAQHEDDVRVARARMLEVDDPAAAARLLNTAIERLTRLGRTFQLTELYLARGRALAQVGNHTAALDDWLAGMDRFEEQRAEVRDEQLRISHFARAWDLYRDATALLVARGETERALALVERGHGRALLDSILPTERPSIATPRDVAASLPPGALALVYQTLPRELLVWSIDRGQLALDRVPVTSDELRRLTSRLSDETNDDVVPAVLDRLSNLLLGSERARARLQHTRSLIVVPDALVAGVPFAALPVPGGAEPLVSRMPITLAPSLSLLDIATRRLDQLGPRSLQAAFFADPALASGGLRLPQLPAARREIEDSASVYAGAQTFIGRDATETRLLNAMGAVDVVHFAGHAVANPEYPSRSRLLTSLEVRGSDDGNVLPQEIAARKAPRARLVLLSACSTATGTPAFGEGVLSLARPFLAAGVPQVIGTLWDIDDRAGGALMPRFHRWYVQGVGAAEALRRAQMELRQSERPLERDIRTWAAFVLVGGLNRFPVPEASR